MPRGKKIKPFRASKEVKRRARLLVGTPPPSQTQESDKGKPPKHKKRQDDMDSL